MNTLKIHVVGRRMAVIDGNIPNTGGKNYDTVAFTLDDAWNGKNIVALFWSGDGDKISVVLDNTRTCAIPSSALQDSRLRLKIGLAGFDGTDIENSVMVISSDVLSIRMNEGAAEGEWNTETVSDTLYEQLLASCVLKETGKGLSANDYTNLDKENVGKLSALLQGGIINGYSLFYTDDKNRLKSAALSKPLTNCHVFPGAGLYSVPSTAAHLPASLSFDPAKHAILLVTDSEVTATTNYRYSLTLIAPSGMIYVKQMDEDGTTTAWAECYAAEFAKKVDKVSGKSLSTNDYTDEEKAAVATIADKLNLPLYDVGNIDANTLTTPGIYAVSYAGPQNFPFTDSGAMPLLIVAESGRMPDISSGSPDFSNAKTLLQICIGKDGEVYSRYKIAGSGDLSDWSWSAWSTKAVSVTNSLGSGSTTAALSAAQGKALDEKKVDKMSGKGLSTNDYTDAEKNKVASAISETDAKAAFAALGKLTDCHGFDGAGIYSIPYNAANLPDGVSFPQDKNAMLVVTYSNNMSWTNYEYSMTLVLPDGVVYTQQRMGEKDYASFTAWTRAYSDKQDKAWQTLANLTVAEGEEASSIKIALPDAITTCNELMIEAEFYVGSEKTTQWRPTFWFADVDKTKYNCWLGGGGNGSVAPGTKYYFELYGWVGDSRLLTFYGPANQHMHANSRATAYMARTSLGYRSGHSSYTCYLHMDIDSNTFTAGTKIKLLGR